ncbi:YjhT family mutarotase [Massilia sp. DWR3-1-1]|uniref:YjhT family mutarotase n=1 Tax=Massilia sp. DWR3-1-1 TaxID=2804559 RepID=UPI003CEAD681
MTVETYHCKSVKQSDQALELAWPHFPLALTQAVGVRLGNTLFAGLGSASQAWFALDITAAPKAWHPRAEFPFAVRKDAVAAAADGKIYVFGGSGRSTGTQSLHQFDSIACYDPQTDCWTELAARLPVGMLGASAAAIGSCIYIFGGYNKPQFDQFFQAYETAAREQQAAILYAFMDRDAKEFAWNDHVWEFDTSDHRWRDIGQVPHAPNCGSGVIVDGGEVFLANGEIKPGLRTASVKHGSIQNGELMWLADKDLPPSDQPQEGIAAAFSGKCGMVKILAGGSNFIGARQNYQSGKKYAHRGLNKLWRDEIYVMRNEMWEFAGRLPHGRANGLSFEVEQGLLLVGGDTQNGQPCLETWLLSYQKCTGITISSHKL